jgi:3-oxoadipate enol-lactonase
MQAITHNDAVFHVAVQGPADGTPVVFANSLGTDLRVWDAIIPLLPQSLRFVRFDLRGHGLSDTTPPPYRMEELADDTAAVLDAQGISGAVFVGLSIGGMIGQMLAARRPDLVSALVLMDTAAKMGEAEMWQARMDAVAAGGIAAMADPILERWFAPGFKSEKQGFFALWRNMLIRTPPEGYIGCCAAIAGADLTDQTRELRLPVLAIVGAEDGASPPEKVQATADLISGAEFYVIAQAGHLPCVERPAETAKLISNFLEKHSYV